MPDPVPVRFELPSVLAPVVDGRRTVEVRAATLAAALEARFVELPALRTHLLDESGALREHVLCVHNGRNARWFDTLEVPVAAGDVVTILQAVSGG